MRGFTYFSTHLTPRGTEAPLWLLLVLPLVGALICGALALRAAGRTSGSSTSTAPGRLSAVIAALAVAATFVAGAALVFSQLLPLPPAERALRWPVGSAALFTIGGLRASFGLFLDPLAAVMVLLVSGLGALIHVYAAAYMRDDPAQPRFFAFLNLFVAAMLLLVLGDGLLPLFFGWEGVGVCSYFLIGFWHRKPAAVSAATKAFIVNRVGDVALLLGVGLMVWGLANVGSRPGEIGSLQVEPRDSEAAVARARESSAVQRRPHARRIPVGPTLSFSEMRDEIGVEIALPPTALRQPGAPADVHAYPTRTLIARMEVAGLPLAFVACVLIFLGAAGKSAQLPFSAWLPDAMAGPTPVSALIHAATMVTAGVYLFARLGFLFALSPGAVTVVVTVGTVTALGAAAAALFQNDLKRVLAYSTVSQLGYMFAATAGGGSSGIFHVVTHGFFKAALFLAAGVFIHAVEQRMHAGGEGATSDDAQDLRKMNELGGLAAELPWTRWAYFVACLALGGFPIASGFYSKDQIFAAVATAPNLLVSPPLVLGALAVTSFLTACYAFRSYYVVFSGARARPSETKDQPRSGPSPAGAERHGSSESRLLAGVVLALGLGAIVAGPLLGWPRNWTPSHATPALDTFLEPVFAGNFGEVPPIEVPPPLEWGLQMGGLAVAVLGWFVARRLYGQPTSGARAAAPAPSGALARFLAGGGGLDAAYRLLAVRPVLALSRAAAWLDRQVIDRAVDGVASAGVTAARFTGLFDRHVVDGAVNGASSGVIAAGRRAARLQSGRLNLYIVLLAAGIAGTVVLVYFFSS